MGFNSRLDIAEININELKDITVKIIQNKTQKEQNLKSNGASLNYGKSSGGLIYV